MSVTPENSLGVQAALANDAASMHISRPCRSLACALAAALLTLPVPAAAEFRLFGKKKVERIQVVPPAAHPKDAPPQRVRPAPPLSGRTACIDVTRVAAAQVFGDASVELTLQGGRRWRVYFEQACPALSFYDGFYYRRAEQGRLCAGRDAVIARSGGECAIASIVPLKPLRRAKRLRRSR